MGSDNPIGPHSTAGECLARYVDLALGVFGSARPTDGDRRELADHLNAEAVWWANVRFHIGLREPADAA